MERRELFRTVGWPDCLARGESPRTTLDGADTSCLKPDVSCRLPRVDILIPRHLGHVELNGSKMRDLGVGYKAENIAGSNGSSTSPGPHLVAAHVGTVHVRHSLVGLVVLSLTDAGPLLCLGLSIDNKGRESI